MVDHSKLERQFREYELSRNKPRIHTKSELELRLEREGWKFFTNRSLSPEVKNDEKLRQEYLDTGNFQDVRIEPVAYDRSGKIINLPNYRAVYVKRKGTSIK